MRETFPADSPFLLEDTRQNRWAIPYHYEALNCRVENIIVNHRSAIAGRNILDLGCHFGTFAYASLLQGAMHVHGVDSEEKLIHSANRLFENAGVARERYHFSRGEIYDFLKGTADNSFDTVLCLGVFYYLSDPVHALREMLRVARHYIIVDTFTALYGACMSKEGEDILRKTMDGTFDLPLVLFPRTQAEKRDYSLPNYVVKNSKEVSLLSLPTERAMEYFFDLLPCRYRKIPWDAYTVNQRRWQDFVETETKLKSHWADIYHTGIRVSYFIEK